MQLIDDMLKLYKNAKQTVKKVLDGEKSNSNYNNMEKENQLQKTQACPQ